MNPESAGQLTKVCALTCVTLVLAGAGAYFGAGLAGWSLLGVVVAVFAGLFVVTLVNHVAGPVFGLPLLFAWSFGFGAMAGPGMHHFTEHLGWPMMEAIVGASVLQMILLGIYGALTSRKVQAWASVLFMGLIGLLVVQLGLALLPHFTWMNVVVGIFGSLLFSGYIIVDFNRAAHGEDTWKAAVDHTLSITIDAVNLIMQNASIFDND